MSQYAELGWTVQAEWLTRLAASSHTQVRALGDGFAVLSGVTSNAHNGVVCSAGAGATAIAATVGWFPAAGVPAQWLVAAGSTLGPRLVAAGCRAERTAVVMGAAIADLPAGAQPTSSTSPCSTKSAGAASGARSPQRGCAPRPAVAARCSTRRPPRSRSTAGSGSSCSRRRATASTTCR